jgi:DNA polymerase-4
MSSPIPERTILHVDMDAFFASVEQRDFPELRGKPVIIGGDPTKRGVVSAASYEARKFGVRSAMPTREAARRCPQGIFRPVRGAAIRQASAQVFAIFADCTPLVQSVSVDEAFLDVSGALHLWKNDPVLLARHIKDRIRKEVGITGSVGIAPNKFLAKLASDLQKPDGLTVVPRDAGAIARFLAPLDVGRVWGVGERSKEALAKRNVHTIGDLQRTPPADLAAWMGEHTARHLLALAFGLDERPVHEPNEEKSVSGEHTYDTDQNDPAVWRQTLLELSEKVGRRLRKAGLWAATVQLKLRYDTFETHTRQMKLSPMSQGDVAIFRAAMKLLEKDPPQRPVRLLGVGACQVTDTPKLPAAQLDLFEPPAKPAAEAKLDRVVDRLREKYGRDALKRGTWT